MVTNIFEVWFQVASGPDDFAWESEEFKEKEGAIAFMSSLFKRGWSKEQVELESRSWK